ncbi:MAG: NADH-quinone oxidoreductase subunit J [Chloroflexi bacterium]|nr:NADH-quinone oxidoreductase subunit J [Chloroflexota bacterium]
MSALIFFFTFALIAVGAAVGMLFSRNAIYAALLLIVNFASVAFLYLSLGAPFIALAQVTVYAGAIMVLFLFVIMLLGAERLPPSQELPWQRPLGIVLAFLLLIEAVYGIVFRVNSAATLSLPVVEFATPAEIGSALFSTYLLPFEITSVLLLVAVVGAIVLTRAEGGARRRALVSQITQAVATEVPEHKAETPEEEKELV